ncbi:MAG: hypothetical protein IPH12_16265 [Saprospirales bacterium]|nr:hypothetical protein [Saprospirales bacterium]
MALPVFRTSFSGLEIFAPARAWISRQTTGRQIKMIASYLGLYTYRKYGRPWYNAAGAAQKYGLPAVSFARHFKSDLPMEFLGIYGQSDSAVGTCLACWGFSRVIGTSTAGAKNEGFLRQFLRF